MDNDFIRKLIETETALRHKLYEMDKEFIVQLCAMEGCSVIHEDITVACKLMPHSALVCYQGTYRCNLNRNGDFSLICIGHNDPTVDLKKCPHNRFIRLNFVVDDDIVQEINKIIASGNSYCNQSRYWDYDFITMIERIELSLKKYEEKVIEKRKQGKKHLVDITLPNDTLGWFKELRIKRAKEELILELLSTYEEKKKVSLELDTVKRLLNTEKAASKIVTEKNMKLELELDTLKRLLNTEREAARLLAEKNAKLKKENDGMTEKLGIIHQKFQAIKSSLCKR
jgi:hypothetical protein